MLYRFRTQLAYLYFQFCTRGLERTPPVPSTEQGRCEIHTMLSGHDVTMYTLAVKSLLSFVSGVAVVVHSDGTLSSGDVGHLRRHIPGVRLVEFAEADRRAERRLPAGSLLRDWRPRDAAYRRLVDVELWRDADKVIILDSDVLTNKRPQEVIEWVRSGTRPFLLGQPPREPTQPPPAAGAHVQRLFLDRVPELSRRLGYPVVFLQGTTAGFCGYQHEISLERVEAALRESLALGLPMHHWGGDQCLIIYLLSVAGGERLPPDRYLNFEPSVAKLAPAANILHFYGTHRFHGLVYPRLAMEAVARLQQGS